MANYLNSLWPCYFLMGFIFVPQISILYKKIYHLKYVNFRVISKFVNSRCVNSLRESNIFAKSQFYRNTNNFTTMISLEYSLCSSIYQFLFDLLHNQSMVQEKTLVTLPWCRGFQPFSDHDPLSNYSATSLSGVSGTRPYKIFPA